MNHDILPNREASRKGSIFDFKAELAARLPVYKAATSATLAQSVEMFCSGQEKAVAVAYIDGVSIANITKLFVELNEELVLAHLHSAVKTITAIMGQQATNYSTTEQDNVVQTQSVRLYNEPGASWRVDAACITEDTELFFDKYEANKEKVKAICGRCAVREACLEVALAQLPEEDFGVMGGLDEDERDKLRKKLKRLNRRP